MPSFMFTLTLPADADYRPIASEVASRYFELVGGAEPERAAFAEAFSRAVTAVAAPGASLEVACVADASQFEMALRCGTRSSVVRQPLPAGKR